ncbi:Conserved protein of unknown function (coil coil domain) [endosymbiont DhMRE of Dentiscutata heterogama]|uniref:DUF6940 family protein n=1 Tax=endosymbiont DhMRE of Dentiscutata heterogama TaxID=1609546 RepID=UPI000629DB04|nr:hypothetical protein [endosymbiont DhMRE of Dentiscutata heterogama]CFW92774.1 Conserved protein of unknown function (coil coil domain) [endosymbiont DhMRE of Dentiscutata heterogama]
MTQITEVENELSNINSKNNQEWEKTIQKLEQEIKKIKEKLENAPNPPPNDTPDNNNPPAPDNSDPNQNKPVEYVATKINDNTFKYHFVINNASGEKLSWKSVISLLRLKSRGFFPIFQGALKDANDKFPAYFWECPPVSKKTLDKPFEFVVIRSDNLNNVKQNWTSFGNHISNNSQKQACSFPGLSGDNILIIPIPKPGPELDFKNISQFTKNGPEEQQQALWQEVAEKLSEELSKSDRPRWLSTHGLGVPYLHVRICERPRYYHYKEYEKWG